MPDEFINIEIKGMKELRAKLDRFPNEVKGAMTDAGKEAAEEILAVKGLRNYTGETSANAPPTPYYIRGSGMMYASGLRATSENLGTQWTVEPRDFKTTISNRASYAKWVHGEQQARAMNAIGWRKLLEVAKEQQSQITTIYNRWINRLLQKLRLL